MKPSKNPMGTRCPLPRRNIPGILSPAFPPESSKKRITGRSSDLSRPRRLPGASRIQTLPNLQWLSLREHFLLKRGGLTATGIVPDFHRIPFFRAPRHEPATGQNYGRIRIPSYGQKTKFSPFFQQRVRTAKYPANP